MPEQVSAEQIADLLSKDEATRRAAATQVGKVAYRALEYLDHEEYLVCVAETLATVGGRPGLPHLQKMLGHHDALVRTSAACAVARIDPELGVPMLEELLDEEDRNVRCLVVEALCAIDWHAGKRILARALLSLYAGHRGIDPHDDWTLDLRRSITRALGRSDDPYVAQSLMAAAGDRDLQVRANAFRALGSLRESRALPILVKGLRDPDPDLRCEALQALSQVADPAAFDDLRRTLDDPDLDVVLAAISALTVLNDRKAVPDLRKLTGRESDKVARAAGQALRDLRADVPVPSLIDLLSASDSDDGQKFMAASMLGVLGDRSAVHPLTTAFGSRSVQVRVAAARALGRLDDVAALGYLVEVLEGDKDPQVREVAAQALGKLGDPSAALALEDAAKSENVGLRRQAEWALLRVGRVQITKDPASASSRRGRDRAPRLLMKHNRFDQRI